MAGSGVGSQLAGQASSRFCPPFSQITHCAGAADDRLDLLLLPYTRAQLLVRESIGGLAARPTAGAGPPSRTCRCAGKSPRGPDDWDDGAGRNEVPDATSG